MNILISHCFLGEPCRYDGCSRLDRQVIELHRSGHNLIPVCPEVLGGLDTPRAPAELQRDGRVVNEDGEDVTAAYLEGAKKALEIARENGCTLAVLKARSPSCGSGEIYDGTFTHTLTPGWAVLEADGQGGVQAASADTEDTAPTGVTALVVSAGTSSAVLCL